MNGVALNLEQRRTLIEYSSLATASRIDELFALLSGCFPRLFLGHADSSISLDALPQTADGALVIACSRCQFHELQILNPADCDAIEAVQGVGVVADVEEDFCDAHRLKDFL